MKIISYSLWGANPIYTYGAIENAVLAKTLFPDYEVFIYYNQTVPKKIIDFLKKQGNVTLIPKNNNENSFSNSVWRYAPMFEKDIDVLLIRDADSRLSKREKEFVDLWLNKTNKNFCIFREFGSTNDYPMGGGTIGIKNSFCNNNTLKTKFTNAKWAHRYDNKNIKKFWLDIDYLKQVVYPFVKNDLIIFMNKELGNQKYGDEKDSDFFIVPKNIKNEYFGDKVLDITLAKTLLNENGDDSPCIVDKAIAKKRFDGLNNNVSIPQSFIK